MGLGAGIANALRALSRGAYDVRGYQKLGPDFRQILASQQTLRDQTARKGEVDIQGGEFQNESRRQTAIRDAVANAANIEPDVAITGMGDVGTDPSATTEDRTSYTAPAGLGVTDDTFGAMARGARTERKSALEEIKGETRRRLQEQAFEQKAAQLVDKHQYTMEELRQKGYGAQEIEKLRQRGRVSFEGVRQGNRIGLEGVRQTNRETLQDTAETGKDTREGAYLNDKSIGGQIYNLSQQAKREPDPEKVDAIKARIAGLTVQRERNARGLTRPRAATTGTPAPAGSPNPASAPKAAPAATPSPAAAPTVKLGGRDIPLSTMPPDVRAAAEKAIRGGQLTPTEKQILAAFRQSLGG